MRRAKKQHQEERRRFRARLLEEGVASVEVEKRVGALMARQQAERDAERARRVRAQRRAETPEQAEFWAREAERFADGRRPAPTPDPLFVGPARVQSPTAKKAVARRRTATLYEHRQAEPESEGSAPHG